jgi:adenylate cyclase
MGIGVNTGEVVVGNIGSHKRTKYGIVGSHVNLTSRVESYTVGGQILISESTRHAVGPWLTIAQQMDVESKGIDQPLTLYDVRGIGGAYQLFLPERNRHLVRLPQALPLHYTVLAEKALGSAVCPGLLVRLSAREGEIRSDRPVALWSNIQIRLTNLNGIALPGSLYGKVVKHLPGESHGFAVHFTSASPEVMTFVHSLLATHLPDQSA